MAEYLVTGAAGFIASRVVDYLLEAGQRVVGIDNLNNAYDVRMKEYRLRSLLNRPGFSFHHQDICNRTALQELFEMHPRPSFAAVINLAARAGVRQSVENPWVYVDTNLTGTLNLLEACRKYHVPKFIVASTSSIYGANPPLPTPETADSDHPLQTYAATKKAAETLCHAYHHLYDIDVTVFRYFTVYGPAGRPDMSMFRFTQWISEGKPVHIFGDGEAIRGFTYVDDIARGTILGLTPVGYEIINLGGHETITVSALIQELEKLIGRRASLVFHPPHRADALANWADIQKAQRLLGWHPQVSLFQGIQNLVAWYKAEHTWASQISTD